MFPSQNKNRKKNRRNNGKNKIVISIAIATAVIVVAVAVYFIFFANRITSLGGTLLRANNEAQIIPATDSIYFLHEKKLSSIDYADNEKWTIDVAEGDNIQFHASDDLVAVYDASTLWVYAYDGSELIKAKKFHGTIKDVRCGKTMVNVLNEDTTGTMHIITLDKSGNEVGSTKYPERFVLDFGFTEGDASYSYTVDSGSLTPISRITTLNEELATIGNVTIEGQVLQHIIFQMDGIYAVGTNHVTKVDYIGAVQSQHLIYGWKYWGETTTKDEKQAILFAPGGETTEESYMPTARLYIPDSPDVYIQLSAGTMHLALGTDKIYAFTAKKLYVYNFSGEKVAEYPLEHEVTAVKNAPGDGKNLRVLLYSEDGVFSLKLP